MNIRRIKLVRDFSAVAVALVVIATPPLVSGRQFTADMVGLAEVRITRFDDVVASVQAGDATDQARFAEIALEIMIAAYLDELDSLDLKVRDGRKSSSSWGFGTRRYVERLQHIARAITPHSALRIIEEPHGAIRLVIDREQVMLNAPRLGDQAKFERSIAENVCRYTLCRGGGTTVEERVAQRSSRLDSGWEFGRKTPPTYSSSDGLRCIFDDRRHLKLKKDACVNLLNELRLLSESIVALKAHGKTIDWQHLRIDHVGAGKPQKVTYSANGSFVRVHLPGLLRAQAVWRGAIPWIKSSLNGHVSQHVINLPDRLVYRTSTIEG